MTSPTRPIGARERAQLRALKETAYPIAEINQSRDTPPRGVITPPPLSIPIPPITGVPVGSVELIGLIPTTRLSLHTTKTTGEINSMTNITATQEDKQANEQEEEEEEPTPDQDLLRVKNRLRDKLIEFQNRKRETPGRVKMSAHDLITLDRSGLIETIFLLKETNIIVETDPRIGEEIQCCDG